jgi:hypothetical protein
MDLPATAAIGRQPSLACRLVATLKNFGIIQQVVSIAKTSCFGESQIRFIQQLLALLVVSSLPPIPSVVIKTAR